MCYVTFHSLMRLFFHICFPLCNVLLFIIFYFNAIWYLLCIAVSHIVQASTSLLRSVYLFVLNFLLDGIVEVLIRVVVDLKVFPSFFLVTVYFSISRHTVRQNAKVGMWWFHLKSLAHVVVFVHREREIEDRYASSFRKLCSVYCHELILISTGFILTSFKEDSLNTYIFAKSFQWFCRFPLVVIRWCAFSLQIRQLSSGVVIFQCCLWVIKGRVQ